MSLKRKFKFERTPLADIEEVKRFKQKFGHSKKSLQLEENSCKQITKPLVRAYFYNLFTLVTSVLFWNLSLLQVTNAILADNIQQTTFRWIHRNNILPDLFLSIYKEVDAVGEDATSIEGHVKVLQEQYRRTQPDTHIVEERMRRTFAWRRKEITSGMTVEGAINKYPFLKSPSGVSMQIIILKLHKLINM